MKPRIAIHVDGRTIACSLLGVEPGELHLQTATLISPGNPVTISFGRVNIAGHVAYSNSRQDGYRIAISIAGETDDREDPRFPIQEPATLIVLPDNGPAWSTLCRLADFSRAGLGLIGSEEVTPGAMVCVETSLMLAAGEIRHIRALGDGRFFIGIRLTVIMVDEQANALSAIGRFRRKLAEWILGRPIAGFRGSPRSRSGGS